MIQIDIDMPKTCYDCPFHGYHSRKDYVCAATPLFYPMNLANYKDGRKDFCPLKEVSQEPRKGKWYRQTNDYVDYYECSECGVAMGLYDVKNYCPNCGSRNEVEE